MGVRRRQPEEAAFRRQPAAVAYRWRRAAVAFRWPPGEGVRQRQEGEVRHGEGGRAGCSVGSGEKGDHRERAAVGLLLLELGEVCLLGREVGGQT